MSTIHSIFFPLWRYNIKDTYKLYNINVNIKGSITPDNLIGKKNKYACEEKRKDEEKSVIKRVIIGALLYTTFEQLYYSVLLCCK